MRSVSTNLSLFDSVDPRYKTDAARVDNRDNMNRILNPVLMQNSSDYWQEKLLAVSIPCTIIENVQSIAENPVATEYGASCSVQNDSGREMRFVRNPIAARDLNETPAPALGQHTAEILAELDLDS